MRTRTCGSTLTYFTGRGMRADRLVLCHMDKRPDRSLHSELAAAGALLDYDTFYRPQYLPDETAWPLIAEMLAAGFERSLALATDIAEAALWKRIGGGAGLPGLLTAILPRLQAAGVTEAQARADARKKYHTDDCEACTPG